VAREVVIKARLVGNTLIIEAPNYRAELAIEFAKVETPNHKAWLDVEDVMEVDGITIGFMGDEDWEELITAIASNGDVEGVLKRITTTRGGSEEEDWWEE
jgi:ClpP class serine protease